MKLTVLALSLLALTACQSFDANSLDNTVGVGADDNAVQCIKANVDGYFTDSNASTTRIEFPSNLNLGTLTPELVAALTEMAARMGCTN